MNVNLCGMRQRPIWWNLRAEWARRIGGAADAPPSIRWGEEDVFTLVPEDGGWRLQGGHY